MGNRINWQSPVNYNDGLTKGLVAWWLVAPHWQGGVTFRDLCNRNHGTLTDMDPSSDWRVSDRPGSWGAVYGDST